MKQLMLIFIGIFSFFSCFAMEKSIDKRDPQILEDAVVLSSILKQVDINFSNPELRLHQAIMAYATDFLSKPSWMKGKEFFYELLLAIKNCAQRGATIDTLAYANYHSYVELAKILIEHGALNYKLIGNEKVATTLQERMVVLNIQSQYRSTILCKAVEARDIDFVWTLLLYGADPNLSMNTPLMRAVSGGFLEGIKLLLEFNADPQRKNESGMTALHHMPYGDRNNENQNKYLADIACELISHGAALNAKNDREQTPLFFAKDRSRLDIIEVLLRLGALHCLSHSEKELTLNYFKRQLVLYQDCKDIYEDRIRRGSELVNIGSIMEDVLKRIRADIKVCETILSYDSIICEQEAKEGTYLRQFLLGQYQKNVARNATFSQWVRQPGRLHNILLGGELNGNRGIKRGAVKRLRSAYEEEDISYIVNYPRESSNSEEKNDTEGQEPKKKKLKK